MRARIREVSSIEKLDELMKSSGENPILIFKHSSTCSISADVFDEISEADAEINVIVVQSARNVSNEIEARTGVRHQSPQAIVLKNGKSIFEASHYDITAEDLEKSLAS